MCLQSLVAERAGQVAQSRLLNFLPPIFRVSHGNERFCHWWNSAVSFYMVTLDCNNSARPYRPNEWRKCCMSAAECRPEWRPYDWAPSGRNYLFSALLHFLDTHLHTTWFSTYRAYWPCHSVSLSWNQVATHNHFTLLNS